MFSNKDKEQFVQKGISDKEINRQIENFREGFPYLNIASAAVVGDGIKKYSPEEVETLCGEYVGLSGKLSLVKFVPASGAATRMFKDLYEFLNTGKRNPSVDEVLANIEKFAFYDKLKATGADMSDPKAVIRALVDTGLGYGKLPKGLITAHKYADGNRTILEEHLAEGAMYAQSRGGVVKIHFTVSPEHVAGFEALVAEVLPKYEEKFGVTYEVTYSTQKSSTDTIAVDMDNQPFREKDGSILFRPAGHGALLENLNDIDADLVFVKTVDNVLPDRLKDDTVKYKKALAAILLRTQRRCFEYLFALKGGANINLLEEIEEFVKDDLAYKFPADFSRRTIKEKAKALKGILDRPIRVCGMVKNEGEPGGGPFWVGNPDVSTSLQIAESSQIAPEQKDLMKNATHFNPVDLVCGMKNLYGEKFDLRKYTDPSTGFISEKSKDGRELKAQELPGLWNGAMARWNTVFVEVPITTFSPVKTVNDLLRPQHQ